MLRTTENFIFLKHFHQLNSITGLLLQGPSKKNVRKWASRIKFEKTDGRRRRNRKIRQDIDLWFNKNFSILNFLKKGKGGTEGGGRGGSTTKKNIKVLLQYNSIRLKSSEHKTRKSKIYACICGCGKSYGGVGGGGGRSEKKKSFLKEEEFKRKRKKH